MARSRPTTSAIIVLYVESPNLDLEDAETVWVAKISAALAKIKTAWRKTVEVYFEVGDLLAAAKEDIGHGNWMRMCETKLPFSVWTARRLMHIAADKRLRNGALVPHLPPNWSILFELSQWDDKELTQALAEGRIHPEMTKEDAVNSADAAARGSGGRRRRRRQYWMCYRIPRTR